MATGVAISVGVIDLTPARLADLLDHLFLANLETDREVAVVLKTARESLRAIGFNRWAQAQTRASRAYTMRRRHQGHQEGYSHA